MLRHVILRLAINLSRVMPCIDPHVIVIFIRRLRQEIKDRRNKYDTIARSIAVRELSSTSLLRPIFFPL